MAASVRIEDEAFGDGRYEHLGALLGTSKYDALGRMAYLWRQCTQEHAHVLPESFVRVYVDAEKLIESRLAERVDGGIRIKGTRGRIEWLAKLRKNGRKGGRPKKPNGSPNGNQERTRTEPESNPPAPAPAPAHNQRVEVAPLPPPHGLFELKEKLPDPPSGFQEVVAAFTARFHAAYGSKPRWDAMRGKQVKALIKSHGADEVLRRLAILFDVPRTFPPPPYDFGTFVQHFDKLVATEQPTAPLLRRSERL